MSKIYKYELYFGHITTILSIPENSQPLSVVEQGGKPFIYILVDTDQPTDGTDAFFVYSFETGQGIPDNVLGTKDFIGTITLREPDGVTPYVLHIFA